jgi:hypothetical protein
MGQLSMISAYVSSIEQQVNAIQPGTRVPVFAIIAKNKTEARLVCTPSD